MTLKKRFFSKFPRILNFGNKFLNPHIKPFFWPERIFWDINFVLKCLSAQCGEALKAAQNVDSSVPEMREGESPPPRGNRL